MRACLSAVVLSLAACTVELAGSGPTAFVPIIPTATPSTGARLAEQAAAWARLGLSGRLLYSDPRQGVLALDLAAGAIEPVWALPERGWLSALAASPAGDVLALAYSPAPPASEPQLGYTNIYLLDLTSCPPAGGCPPEAPRPLAETTNRYEAFFQPAWLPDGTAVYASHVAPTDAQANTSFRYSLARLDSATGQAIPVVDDAMWPAISPDGQFLAYVYVDPADNSNALVLAGADGSGARTLVTATPFEAIDAVLFSPDGRELVFSAVSRGAGREAPAPVGWLARLLSPQVAEAHNVPSDWWAVSIGGGESRRLTQLLDTGLAGAFSPDGAWLAFSSSSGLNVMRPDGSELTQLVPGAFSGTVSWVED